MEITILSDNKVVNPRPKELKAEWGFSALVDKVLFDTGQSGVAFDNLMVLKKEQPSKLVLSHGHYDHTGGIVSFIKHFDLEIYAHPDAFLPRFYRGDYIGLPVRRELIEDLSVIHEHRDPVNVTKNVVALGEIPRKKEQHLLSDSFVIRDGIKERDTIRDDQSLAVKTKGGLILLLGCCHSGLRNTVEYAEDVVGDEVKAIVGGTHLTALKGDKLLEIIKWIDKKVEFIAPCHCTGLENEFLLKEKLGDKCKLIGSGTVLEF